MIATDEESLICDLAETYHILNYRELPCRLAALLSVGLREDSRIKMKISGKRYPLNTELLAMIVDQFALFIWSQSKDGIRGINKPVSIFEQLQCETKGRDVESFETAEEFEMKKQEIIGKGEE